MTSIDSNIFLYSYSEASPFHPVAKAFIEALSARDDVAVSEFVLAEFSVLLRNPAVLEQPLTATEAGSVIQHYRKHPRWRVVGFPPNSEEIHTALWDAAGGTTFPRRGIFDLRMALCLQAFGVTEFATSNTKDFADVGFRRVWNPLHT